MTLSTPKPERLVIVSHTPHYRRGRELVGWGPTVREIDRLATLYDEVVHVAPLYEGEPSPSALPYTSPQIRLRTVVPAGGDKMKDKLEILLRYPSYAGTILEELAGADAVHVRFPANISLLALLLLVLVRQPSRRWFKYAGNWQAYDQEPWAYRLQRRLLAEGWGRGIVSVNGHWPNQPPHVRTFMNPSLTDEELRLGREHADDKVLAPPLRLLFVGRLEHAKGAWRAVRILEHLVERGLEATLDLVGSGPERAALVDAVEASPAAELVELHGWLPRHRLPRLYGRSHFLLLPSTCSEGWPKVLSEAMAHGVVPLASNVSSIPQYLDAFDTGRALDAHDTRGYVRSAMNYVDDPERWRAEVRRGLEAAQRFTYTAHLEAVRGILAPEKANENMLDRKS